jgi:molybdopterin-guanine dinucleotide biosynthesis protein A
MVMAVYIIIKSMLTIAIQAGGESRRMGQDKALLPFLGKPLIQRVIERLSRLADELFVTTNQPEAYRFLGLPLVPDVIPGRGALGGLFTALSAARQPLVAVVACDMPFASPGLLEAERSLLLATGSDAVIPQTEGGTEPFHAVYRREACLPAIQAAMAADRWRVDAWFSQVRLHLMLPQEVRPYDPGGIAFWNVNTPQELAQAEELAQRIDLDAVGENPMP